MKLHRYLFYSNVFCSCKSRSELSLVFFFGREGGGELIVFWVQVQVIGQIIHDICFEFC